MARLVFAVPLHTNKGDDILSALQQVYISLRSLNLPVLRFHTGGRRVGGQSAEGGGGGEGLGR